MPNGSIEVANWVGPSTQVIKRLKRGDKGKTATDTVAMRHDLDYSIAQTLDDIRSADRRMINKLTQIQSNKADNLINILAGKKAIQSKVYLEDKGLLSKNAFADFKDNLQDGYGFKKNIQPLYSNEIEEYLKFIPIFKGVFPKDELVNIKIKKNEPIAIVINLENSDKGGSHWVALYNDKNLPYVEFFCPFGIEPPIEVEKFASRLKKPIMYNPYQHQKITSFRCGYYCVHYIIKRYSGMLSDVVLSKFTKKPSEKNERLSVQF